MGEVRAPSRWWALLLVVPAALFVIVGAVPDLSPGYLTRLYFAGDPCRWQVAALDRVDLVAVCGSVGSGGVVDVPRLLPTFDVFDRARSALVLDLAFAATFAAVASVLLQMGRASWAPARRRGDRWIWKYMPAIAVGAGALDLVETSGQLIWLESIPPHGVAVLVATIAWWKWVLYLVALVGVFGLVIGPVSARPIRRVMGSLLGLVDRVFDDGDAIDTSAAAPMSAEKRTEVTGDERLGITASGGGIRSAAVMSGIFRGLARDGTLQRATWLHAVSGGGFASGGWRASSLARDELDLFNTASIEGEMGPPAPHPWMASVRHRRRYLDNGAWSIVGGAIGVMVRMVLVLGSVLAAAVLVGWTAGWLTGSFALHPGFSNAPGGTGFDELIEWRLVVPGAVPVIVALVVVLVSRTSPNLRTRSSADGLAKVLGGLGVALLVVLVVVPIGIWAGRPLLASFFSSGDERDGAETSATWVAVLSGAGLAGAVWKMLQAEITRRWSRLGGVFLLVGLLAIAGKVADDRANGMLLFRGLWVPVVAVVWIVVVDAFPSHRLTLNGIYRKRLAETFLLGPGDHSPLDTISYGDEPLWPNYVGADGPELVLCGTAQSTKLELGGLPALGFTFRPTGVNLYRSAPGFSASYPTGSSWQGFPRRWTVSRSMALAGAAFSSAMGRQSFGTTNALLAAVNLRLGMWVPNPLRQDWFDAEEPDERGVRYPAPRVHLGYFLKEIFNRYDAEDDAFVYVTDGGHRDNLGVVEQLRERPSRMIILDASGDRRGGFGTMRQAIALADVELGVQIDLDWQRIAWPDHDVPADCVTTGTATFRDASAHVTRIVYAKAQVSDTTPSSLRQFAASDPKFPDYSTGNQFLTADQFDRLVEFGSHMAHRIHTFVH